MRKLVLRPSALLVFVAVGLLCITSIGGCPAPQTPTTPAAEDDTQATQTVDPTGDNGLDRPITPPDFNGDTTTSDSGDTTSDGSTPSSGSEGDPAFVLLSINQPSSDIAVAVPPRVTNGATVSLVFNLTDATGSVVKGELLLARDDNQDGQPDGAPVHVQETAISAGSNTWFFDTDTAVAKGLLDNHFGRFLLGARVTTVSGDVTEAFSLATILIDGIAPQWTWNGAGPSLAELDMEDHLVNRDTTWTLSLDTDDNSPHTWRVMVDMDLTPGNGNEYQLVPETKVPAGAGTQTPSNPLALFYPADTYYYYVTVADEVDPPVARYVESGIPGQLPRLSITNRLIGEFDLNQLQDEAPVSSQSKGAIMQGFNFNDLAGSSLVSVPDLDGDGDSELVIGARFGKPNLNFFEGRGWGEAYLIYGDGNTRLTGQQTVNSVGVSIPGLTFRGIRVPLCEGNYTEGLSDITVIDDMDGDDLPELVFSFPRVESLNLGAPDWVGSKAFQHPELLVDEATASAGSLEYDAINYMGGSWVTNRAQFTRGGIVVVSSHNELLTAPNQVTRKFDRVLDLHEIGQLFTWMNRPSPWPYIRSVGLDPSDPFGCVDCIPQLPSGCECEDTNENPDDDCVVGCGDCFGSDNIPEETEYYNWIIKWDVWLGGA